MMQQPGMPPEMQMPGMAPGMMPPGGMPPGGMPPGGMPPGGMPPGMQPGMMPGMQMPGMPPVNMPPPGMQRQMAKLEKDTYAVRKLEGRPKHTQTSFAVLIIGVISWFLVLLAFAVPEWQANWIGVLGYPYKRSWGFFVVSGMETHMNHEMMSDTCRYYSQLAPGGMCASPICMWYRRKCQVYMDYCWMMYGVAFFYFICIIIHSLCMVWTSRMTPKMIRWAATWWVATVIMKISLLMLWYFMSIQAFADLDSEAYYPEPDWSISFYAEFLSLMLLMTNCSLSITLMKMWPETSTEDSSDEDAEGDYDYDMGFGGMMGGMMGGPPMQQMGPPGGYPQQQMPPPGYGGPPPGGPPMMDQGGYAPPPEQYAAEDKGKGKGKGGKKGKKGGAAGEWIQDQF